MNNFIKIIKEEIANFLSEDTSSHEHKIAYKVMPMDENGDIVSGANKRLNTSNYKKGSIVSMEGNGIYMSPNKEYVLDYYSGLADHEVLITFEFHPEHIITGDLNDSEPEISVSQARILNIENMEDGELLSEAIGKFVISDYNQNNGEVNIKFPNGDKSYKYGNMSPYLYNELKKFVKVKNNRAAQAVIGKLNKLH